MESDLINKKGRENLMIADLYKGLYIFAFFFFSHVMDKSMVKWLSSNFLCLVAHHPSSSIKPKRVFLCLPRLWLLQLFLQIQGFTTPPILTKLHFFFFPQRFGRSIINAFSLSKYENIIIPFILYIKIKNKKK